MITKYFFIAILFIISIVLYFPLYKSRSLQTSFRSYIYFLMNYIILVLYSLSFLLLIQGIDSPIYIEDLSEYSQYKYLLLVLFTTMGLILFILAKRMGFFKNIFDLITYPYFIF